MNMRVASAARALSLLLLAQLSPSHAQDPDCSDMIKNGDFDNGSYVGWAPHDEDGTLMLFPQSVSGNRGDMSLLHSGRTNVHSGPEHLLDVRCFNTRGDRLTLTAYVKLLKDDKGYMCDREVTDENNPLACPVMTLQAVLPDGKYHYRYAVNTAERAWDADKWNEEHFYVDVDEGLANAVEVRLYVERVAVGVDIVLDHVKVTETTIEGDLESLGIPDQEDFNETDIEEKSDQEQWDPTCKQMIVNGDAEVSVGVA